MSLSGFARMRRRVFRVIADVRVRILSSFSHVARPWVGVLLLLVVLLLVNAAGWAIYAHRFYTPRGHAQRWHKLGIIAEGREALFGGHSKEELERIEIEEALRAALGSEEIRCDCEHVKETADFYTDMIRKELDKWRVVLDRVRQLDEAKDYEDSLEENKRWVDLELRKAQAELKRFKLKMKQAELKEQHLEEERRLNATRKASAGSARFRILLPPEPTPEAKMTKEEVEAKVAEEALLPSKESLDTFMRILEEMESTLHGSEEKLLRTYIPESSIETKETMEQLQNYRTVYARLKELNHEMYKNVSAQSPCAKVTFLQEQKDEETRRAKVQAELDEAKNMLKLSFKKLAYIQGATDGIRNVIPYLNKVDFWHGEVSSSNNTLSDYMRSRSSLMCLIYTKDKDRLIQTVRSASGMASVIHVIDNSIDRDLSQGPLSSNIRSRLLSHAFELVSPTVPLTKAQAMNLCYEMTLDRERNLMFVLSEDTQVEDAVFERMFQTMDSEAMRMEANRGMRDWGIMFTKYDALVAYQVSKLRDQDMGFWDMNMADAFADKDIYYRMKVGGFRRVQAGAQGVSQTKDDPALRTTMEKKLEAVAFAKAKKYYIEKWGGAPNAEKHKIPFGIEPTSETNQADVLRAVDKKMFQEAEEDTAERSLSEKLVE